VVISPGSLTFLQQNVGTTSAAQTVKLTNNTPNGLVMGTVGATGAFKVSSNGCTGTIASGGSCTIGVEFAPTQAGTLTGTLSINDSDASRPQMVWLQGTGIGAALSPTTLTFAARDGGTASAAQATTLTNYLSSSLNITSATIIGPNAPDFAFVSTPTACGTSLGGTSNCTYNITFTPSVNGPESATLSVSDADGTQTATLQGTGIGAALSPTTLTFAAQDRGVPSAAKTVTLTDYLSSSLAITGAAILPGPYWSDFAIASTTCGNSLGAAPSNTCTYSITFTPSFNGPEWATLNVTDADGSQGVTLKGTGK
jgi:hypothetical protein